MIIFTIFSQNSINLFRIDLKNVWGHVNFYARGAGQAVAQLDVNYGVDYEPFKVRTEFLTFMIFLVSKRLHIFTSFATDVSNAASSF